jgi:DNA-binding Xre family transcriptional regulator
MIHRHLAYPPDTPVEALPTAALVDILERGDLQDWRPLAAAVARDPLGPFAEKVMRLVDAYPMYGTSALWRAWIDRCRARAEGVQRSEATIDLPALRRRRGLTQVDLAGRLSMSQSDLSKLERRRDARISTLEAYVKALGGRLMLVCAVGRERVRIKLRG